VPESEPDPVWERVIHVPAAESESHWLSPGPGRADDVLPAVSAIPAGYGRLLRWMESVAYPPVDYVAAAGGGVCSEVKEKLSVEVGV
jgi:hypothetical protein